MPSTWGASAANWVPWTANPRALRVWRISPRLQLTSSTRRPSAGTSSSSWVTAWMMAGLVMRPQGRLFDRYLRHLVALGDLVDDILSRGHLAEDRVDAVE